MHQDTEGHNVSSNTVKVLDQVNTKRAREFLDDWYSTGNAINKHIEMDRSYFPLRMQDLMKSTKIVSKNG